MTFEETDGLKCTIFKKIAQKNVGLKNFGSGQKMQISLDLKILGLDLD